MIIPYVNALKNSDAFQLVKHDVDAGALSHAYMIVSPDADAVAGLFTLIACAAYCKNDVCLECRDCLKVINRNHADVIYINELGQNIKVDEIRELIEDSYLKPYESDRKLYFIYSADKMSAAAQNKLLKTLEEPPAGVSIFLGVRRESAMLDTVKSRARKIYLDRFSEKVIYDEIFAETKDEKKARIASVCADGLLGKAEEISKNKAYEDSFDGALNLLTNMKKSSDIASFLGDKALVRDDLSVFLDTLSLIMRDMLIIKTNADAVLAKHKMSEIAALSAEYSPRALANILYLINEERKKIEANVSKAAVFENLLFGILEVKFKCR